MAKFHSLIVTDVKKTIRDAIVVSLKSEHDVADFDFTQGQYLTFAYLLNQKGVYLSVKKEYILWLSYPFKLNPKIDSHLKSQSKRSV